MDRPRILSRDTVKLLAVAAMACNHAAHALLPGGGLAAEILTDIGYFTAVTMCYFLVEGFGYTRSRKRYALRLLAFAAVSQPVYGLALGLRQLNMLFTLLLCFLMLWALDALRGSVWQAPAVLLLAGLTAFCDWPMLAACDTLLFAFCRGRRRWLAPCFVLAAALFFWFQLCNYTAAGWDAAGAALHSGLSCLGPLAAGAVILLLYNGRRAAWALRRPAFAKYFFYLFYPAHLAVLALLRRLAA